MRRNEPGWWLLGILTAVLVPALGHGSDPDESATAWYGDITLSRP